MTDQNKPSEKSEMRAMWIATALIVLVLLGGMGINMLLHHDTSAATPESQSGTVLPK